MRTSLPSKKADESQKIMLLVKNLSTQWRETEKENWTKNQSMKNSWNK